MQPVFTQPVLTVFTIQASTFWLLGYTSALHFVVLSPHLTLHDAFCCLYIIIFKSFNFGFRRKKKKKKKKLGGLVICK